MKKILLILFAATVVVAGACSETVIAYVFARQTTSLNGQWHVIVDPYDTDYFDYRRQPYDASARPGGGFFLDRQAKGKNHPVGKQFRHQPDVECAGRLEFAGRKTFLLRRLGLVSHKI